MPAPIGAVPDDFARLRIEHRDYLVATGGENPMMRGVERDPARFFTGRERPARHHFAFGGVDRGQFAFVFDVDINASAAGSTAANSGSPPAKSLRQPSGSWH